MHSFPIDSVKNEILNALETVDFLVIKSTPGSGKTTRVPLFLRGKYKKKIYVLEPRKLAAKLASGFVAKSIGEKTGESVGHIFKYEHVASEKTQIIFLTEGTFLRILSKNSGLDDCDVVILDEFHERHYYTDVALSFLLKIKETNKNLKIIIMSATINLTELDSLLMDKSKTIELNESRYPLSIEYLPNDTLVLKDPLERKVYNALENTIDRDGHILIFLSGMYEIKKCEEMIRSNFNLEIVILHGEVSGVVISDDFYNLSNKRVILSTNIAESSVTIPGVRTVIDTGFHKISTLNPVTRLPIIELKKISKSSAIQRANRASREGAGLVLRLYSELDYQLRDHFDMPEINRTDLSELLINSADLFNEKIENFTFITPLKLQEIEKAKKYLEQVGFLEGEATTALAKKLSGLPFHPRITKILDEVSKTNEASFSVVLEYLANLVEPRGAARFKNLAKSFFKADKKGNEVDFEKLILFGYVDQIAKKVDQKLIHMNGETYTISPKVVDEIDPKHELWIILDLDNRNHVVRLLPIEEEWLYDLPYFPIEEVEKVDFDVDTLKLTLERINRIGAIVLSKEKVVNVKDTQGGLDYAAKKLMPIFMDKLDCSSYKRLLLMEKYSKFKIADFHLLAWFKEQVRFLLADRDYSLEVIMNSYVDEIFRYLNEDLGYKLDLDLPLFLQLNDKRSIPIYYDATNGAHCESYVQDFYGLTELPAILGGKEKVKIHLIGPHKRALQVTTNLANFWEKTYKELYNELKRDYPRHHWPMNPESARPILLLRNVK